MLNILLPGIIRAALPAIEKFLPKGEKFAVEFIEKIEKQLPEGKQLVIAPILNNGEVYLLFTTIDKSVDDERINFELFGKSQNPMNLKQFILDILQFLKDNPELINQIKN